VGDSVAIERYILKSAVAVILAVKIYRLRLLLAFAGNLWA
jgi:hypothetical protein